MKDSGIVSRYPAGKSVFDAFLEAASSADSPAQSSSGEEVVLREKLDEALRDIRSLRDGLISVDKITDNYRSFIVSDLTEHRAKYDSLAQLMRLSIYAHIASMVMLVSAALWFMLR